MVFIYFSRGKIHDMKELDAFLLKLVMKGMGGWVDDWLVVGLLFAAVLFLREVGTIGTVLYGWREGQKVLRSFSDCAVSVTG